MLYRSSSEACCALIFVVSTDDFTVINHDVKFSVKHTAVDMESRVPVLTVSCPGGVRFMSWRGTSSVQTSAALSALGGSDMYHTSHGQTALQPDARGGAFTSDESKNEKNPVYLADNHSIVSSQSVMSSRDDICRNRFRTHL